MSLLAVYFKKKRTKEFMYSNNTQLLVSAIQNKYSSSSDNCACRKHRLTVLLVSIRNNNLHFTGPFNNVFKVTFYAVVNLKMTERPTGSNDHSNWWVFAFFLWFCSINYMVYIHYSKKMYSEIDIEFHKKSCDLWVIRKRQILKKC